MGGAPFNGAVGMLQLEQFGLLSGVSSEHKRALLQEAVYALRAVAQQLSDSGDMAAREEKDVDQKACLDVSSDGDSHIKPRPAAPSGREAQRPVQRMPSIPELEPLVEESALVSSSFL